MIFIFLLFVLLAYLALKFIDQFDSKENSDLSFLWLINIVFTVKMTQINDV